MKVLVTGGNGQLGRCLQDRLQYTDYEWQAPDQSNLDITDRSAIATYFKIFQPDIVINAAAYTAVDKAESDQENAYLVNATAPGYLAESCQTAAIPLIHISTDYVFDGTATVPYKVSDQTNPQSVYGSTKLVGEQIVQSTLSEHIIIRTAWVFSEYGNNFVKTMLRLANFHPVLKIVGDQYGCPTYAGDLADVILKMVMQVQFGQKLWGLYHYCGDQITSWHGFARAIFDEAKRQGIIDNIPQLRVINTDEYPVAAQRPQYSVLDCQLSFENYHVEIANWRKALTRVINKI
ncbi:dTDP-4-dehydrorhamnose reductase [Celerinatantimonas diazotrophica]|uniref:dTDP-4-dehydrorhamnose reductase n=1 Tax=Celerinatantimonas diazotrophica TaxID=412034 RepID=A0A4V2PRJ2_9GAMM|nr:dTDP-4-dehydrorhamnose reductase [Celerinatantimonas diazotrophica]TCK59071.1 dTDP-4-dehydrorhamnose reductase [Celerinatantimonas diazotrophica]CAG9297708.1 dTDP-4-dehydrorhamnose reductase [Celerinatantimonas diazotrophica]